MPKCIFKNCNITACFNYPDQIKGLYCKTHKLEHMIDITHKTCIHENCLSRPNFNFINELQPLYCSIHKLENMVDIIHQKCIFNECYIRAHYNYINEKKALYCSKHKLDNMIDISNKKCIYEKCNSQPCYNNIGEQKALYCFKHKLNNMVNVKTKICIFENCKTQATFNYSNNQTSIYCSKHKLPNMININDKTCIYENCKIRPSFNNIGETKGLYCVKHKLENMVNVIDKKCLKCNTKPSCNYIDETKPLYCGKHKLENMVCLSIHKIIKCITENCENTPLYNFKNKKAIYCDIHKQENMVIVSPKCNLCKSNSIQLINNKYYCLEHLPDKKTIAKFKKLCKYCDNNEHSSYVCNECKQHKHKKEYDVVKFLRKNIDTPFIYDKNNPVSECSKKRPDIFFDLKTHIVIVEVDENQHKSYSDSCECARLNVIVNSLGGIPVTFIRYNPDKIKKLTINKEERLELLKQTIKEELMNIPDKFQIKLIQLYYDDNYKEYIPKKIEDITKFVCV